MARNTIPITQIIQAVNQAIAESPAGAAGRPARVALAELLSGLLMGSDAYRGFQYRAWAYGGYTAWLEAGSKPGEQSRYCGDITNIEFF